MTADTVYHYIYLCKLRYSKDGAIAIAQFILFATIFGLISVWHRQDNTPYLDIKNHKTTSNARIACCLHHEALIRWWQGLSKQGIALGYLGFAIVIQALFTLKES